MKLLSVLICCLLLIPLIAQADVDAGKKLATQCESCHGASGKSSNPEYPSLAGMESSKFIQAMKDYKSGAKKSPMMNMLSKSFSDTDIEHMAAYFSGLK